MDFLNLSLKVLKHYSQSPGHNLKRLISHFLDSETEGTGSHPEITRTVYGVIRNESLLDFIIQHLTGRKPKKLEREVLLLLRIGIFLSIFSESYPGYAVVNEIVRRAKKSAKGFLNAVLRRCIAERESIHTLIDSINNPHIKYSISPLLVENIQSLSQDITPFLQYLDNEPLFHIRVNTKEYRFDQVMEVLTRAGLEIRPLQSFESFLVKNSGGSGVALRRLLNENKYFYFQNTASQIISIIAAQYAKEKILDCCAAPGTKSTTLSMIRPDLSIFANDINPYRVSLISNFCIQYHLDSIHPIASDAVKLGVNADFDFIILDAPCTSSGTLRKNPDLKLKIDHTMIQKNTALQREILQSILALFPRAYILYSVCSFIKEETEDVVGFETIDLSPILDAYGFNYKKANRGFYLLPHPVLNNDLFYLAFSGPTHGPPVID
jgi:16S rRNA (cytosine967-C5)-methyltransferase